ncbi:MAG: hypothetical protein L0219_21490, partial [Phycisphaerales bacterium]|nr:hypothetical protein [Phycisphaerales bacterium]
MVFEHDFEIWKLDTASNQAAALSITRWGAPAGTVVEHRSITENFQELVLSPDGKKIAFIARGEVFAASARDGGDAARITRTAENESQVIWSPDSIRLVYASDREGPSRLFLYEFGTNSETRLTNAGEHDHSARFSPDGKSIAFIRGSSELRVLDVTSKQDRVVGRGSFELPPFTGLPPFAWSPDNRWIAFLSAGPKGFTNVQAVSHDGATSRPVSFLANSFSATVSWSPEGTFLLFDTGQRTEPRQIARVDLIPRTPRFREDQFRDLFREESPRPSRPAEAPQQQPAEPAADAKADATGISERKPVEILFDD